MASAPAFVTSSLSGPRFQAARFWIVRLVTILLVIGFLVFFHKVVTPKLGIYDVRLLVLALLFATLATSLNLINGITGQFSIGHAAFYLIGAMTSGKLTLLFYKQGTHHPILWLGLMVVAGAIAAAIAGLMVGLPSLRLRGDYLAVATLGFGEIVNVILRNQDGGAQAITLSLFLGIVALTAVLLAMLPLWNRYVGAYSKGIKALVGIGAVAIGGFAVKLVHGALWWLIQALNVPIKLDSRLDTGGPTGIQSVPKLTEIWCIILLFIFTLAIVRNLLKSAHGLSFLAVREDELAADATGVSTTHVKVQAFVIGAALAGMAGALFAHYNGPVIPDDFKMDVSFILVAMVVIGGTGSITGAATAGIAMKLLEEGLRKVPKIPATDFYGLILAGIAVAVLFSLLSRKHVLRTEGKQGPVWSGLGVLACAGVAWLGFLTYGQDLSWILKIATWVLMACLLIALLATPVRRTALPRFGMVALGLGVTIFVGPMIGDLLQNIGSLHKLVGDTVYAASDLRWAMFSAALVLVMILKPTGILGHHEFSWSFFKSLATGRVGRAEAS